MRKWRPPETAASNSWQTGEQILVSREYRTEILDLAHNMPMAGHLGVCKTNRKAGIMQHFYWSGLPSDIAHHCRTCHICHVVGKHNFVIPKAPLKPIPTIRDLSAGLLLT